MMRAVADASGFYMEAAEAGLHYSTLLPTTTVK